MVIIIATSREPRFYGKIHGPSHLPETILTEQERKAIKKIREHLKKSRKPIPPPDEAEKLLEKLLQKNFGEEIEKKKKEAIKQIENEFHSIIRENVEKVKDVERIETMKLFEEMQQYMWELEPYIEPTTTKKVAEERIKNTWEKFKEFAKKLEQEKQKLVESIERRNALDILCWDRVKKFAARDSKKAKMLRRTKKILGSPSLHLFLLVYPTLSLSLYAMSMAHSHQRIKALGALAAGATAVALLDSLADKAWEKALELENRSMSYHLTYTVPAAKDVGMKLGKKIVESAKSEEELVNALRLAEGLENHPHPVYRAAGRGIKKAVAGELAARREKTATVRGLHI